MADEVKAVTICIKTAGHEELDGIMGGDNDGHYHLSQEEYELLMDLLQRHSDELESEEEFYKLTETEYNKLMDLFDRFLADEEDEEQEAPLEAFVNDSIEVWIL